MAERSPSINSVSKSSPTTHSSNKPKHTRKAHTAGHGRPHTRNPSYGNNLNKLTKLHADDETPSTKKPRPKANEPSQNPTTSSHVKRNSSNVSLPRIGSKTSIKRNSSNISLHKNGHKNSRPTTPIRRTGSHPSKLDQLSAKGVAKFSIQNDDGDDEWTEESASQSPETTRRSSLSKSGKATPLRDETRPESRAKLPESPLESSISSPSQVSKASTARIGANSYSEKLPFRPPTADMITSRLLSRGSSSQLAPQVTSISATGTPTSQTPPIVTSQELDSQDTAITSQSYPTPDNGQSRFLIGPNSRASRSSVNLVNSQVNSALTHLQTPPTPHLMRTRSISPDVDENLRRDTSSLTLINGSRVPIVTPDDAMGRASPVSYTFQAPPQRLLGGNTQAKMDLWRTQTLTNVEPSHHQQYTHGSEERRVRLWQEAESEIGYIRRFRNPVIEGVKRVQKTQKKKDKEAARDGARERDRDGAERTRNPQSRPGSRPGSRGRGVRFEVGMDEVDGQIDQGDSVEDLLRSMWEVVVDA